MKTYTTATWFELVQDVHNLIISEFDQVEKEITPEHRAKLLTMYEFFRCLRGEAFYHTRPHGLGDKQQHIYAMEDDLAQRFHKIKNI